MSEHDSTPAAPLPSTDAAAVPPATPSVPATAEAQPAAPAATEVNLAEVAPAEVAGVAPSAAAVDGPAPDAEANSAVPDAAGHEAAAVAAGDSSDAPVDAAVAAAAAPRSPKPPEMPLTEVANQLKTRFPALFAGQPKPLKLRIQSDIQERAPGVFSKPALSAFFRRYTGGTGYLIALGKATQRFDLDGQPAGELSEEHRQLARDELTRRRQVVREREQQAHAQQQAAQAEVMAARQARASLLRDFQRTTLTLANFCALKGMTAEELNPVLDQARQEAAEAPPQRLHDDR
ncbi:MAG: hypothetical protein CFE45_24360, partial [Burkholderiales bacterium PBB5]